LEQLYGPSLKSCIASPTQERLFPREWFTDNFGRIVKQKTVPTCWQEAQCEIALMYRQDVDVFPMPPDAPIKSESVRLGELGESTTYAGVVQKERFAGFRKVDLILEPILNKRPGNWRIVA
jgi:hypothetical protein